MINFYCRQIKRGRMTIADVPDRWYYDVIEALGVQEGEV